MTEPMYDLFYIVDWVITCVLKIVVICTILPLTLYILQGGRNGLQKLRKYRSEDR